MTDSSCAHNRCQCRAVLIDDTIGSEALNANFTETPVIIDDDDHLVGRAKWAGLAAALAPPPALCLRELERIHEERKIQLQLIGVVA